jgi:transcriptional regulator with XRE-family HTH domain
MMKSLIRRIREENNLTQDDVAKIMNVKREVISYYETEKRPIPLVKLEKLLSFLGLTQKDIENENFKRNLVTAYRKEQLKDEDFEKVIWLNNFVNNLFEIKKINKLK